MSLIQMAQRLKLIHPDYVLIFKVGTFCNTFGKDSYIIASTFNYAIKRTKNVAACGFPKKVLRKSCFDLGRKED